MYQYLHVTAKHSSYLIPTNSYYVSRPADTEAQANLQSSSTPRAAFRGR